uniref:Putative conserved secreted protein n=1 Tax=Culex tarsalis TaxID=7177 RepID=A0A1Q3EVM5_CULTA
MWISLLLLGTALLAGELHAVKISCIKCSSQNDPNCSRAKLQPSECAQEDDQCYMRILNGHLVRGCYKDQTQNDQVSCDINGGLCIKCEKSSCNNVYWPRCHKCEEPTDPNCSGKQTGLVEATFCSSYAMDNFCYARVNNGLVSRGCGREYPACLTDRAGCQMCYSDGCNGLAKADLQSPKCQKCQGVDDACIEGSSSALNVVCSRLGDGCYTTITDNKVERGCLDFSGTDRIHQCSDPADTTCVSCQGANCNNQPWLRCHQCRVTDSDKSCNDEKTNLTSASFCSNYQPGDKCYSRTVDGVFERGCQSTLGVNANACDKLGANECQLCADPGCNKLKNSADRTFLQFTVLITGVVSVMFL